MSTEQFEHYFNTHSYTQEQILEKKDLFASAAFVEFAKQLPRYPEYVTKHYNEYRKFNAYTKFVGRIFSFYTPGFQDIFTRLYKECEEERLAQEVYKLKDRKEPVKEESQLKEIAAYFAKPEALTDNELISDAVPHQHRQARDKAYAHTKTTAVDRVIQKYTIAPDTITFAQEYDIAKHDLNTMCGNTYEQQLHSEFLEQLDEAHTISTYYALQPRNILIDAVGNGVAIGLEANRLQQSDTATTWANFGWKALEYIEAMGEGLMICAENTADMVLHPKHTLKEAVHGIGMFISICAQAIGYTVGTAIKLNVLKNLEEYDAYVQEVNQITNNINALQTLCSEKLFTIPTKDLVKHGTVIVADILLTHKIFMLGSTLCTHAAPVIRNALARVKAIGEVVTCTLETARAESPVLQTAEGILIKVSEGLVEDTKNSLPLLETFNAEVASNTEKIIIAVEGIVPNKIYHILTPHTDKHAWSKIIDGEVTWNKVKDIIVKVMTEGTLSQKEQNVFEKAFQIGSEIVDVRFVKLKDGSLHIGSAWVRTCLKKSL